MTRGISILGLLLVASPHAAHARSVEVCPELPAGSSIEWTYNEGPDFDVCYAHPSGSDEMMFGVYLGNHPSFRPKRSSRIGKGKVAGHRIVWYRPEPSNSPASLYRQTLLTLDPEAGYVAHLWVVAETEQEMRERLSILEHIRFKSP